jgi:RND family efflux transporter MFP subunit
MKVISKPVLVTTIAVILIGAAVIYNGKKIAENNAAPRPTQESAVAQSVSVVKVRPDNYQAYITGHGEAQAHWTLSLKSQVQGEVTSLNEQFESGRIVNQGTILANIDNTQYLQAISNAKKDLADAELLLQEEKDLSQQAKREWERSGVKQAPSSPLVFRTLQLAAAQASADDAQNSVQTAIRDENNTHIRVPFNAVIVTRDIDLGSYVAVGDTIATLNSSDRIEIAIPLSLSQFQQLSDDLSGEVILRDVSTGATWTGYIARVENHLDANSRQRNIIVAVEYPLEQSVPLLPGAFLEAQIVGKSLDSVLKVPSSAISQDGQVWLVDENNTLISKRAIKLFERGEDVYISPVTELDEAQVVVRPLVSYLNGMLVNPMVEE